MKDFIKMSTKKPEVGTTIKFFVQGEEHRVMRVVGYFDETHSVFLYEAPYTPEVHEVDDVYWTPCLAQEMKSDLKDVQDVLNDLNFVSEYLIRKGWKKE